MRKTYDRDRSIFGSLSCTTAVTRRGRRITLGEVMKICIVMLGVLLLGHWPDASEESRGDNEMETQREVTGAAVVDEERVARKSLKLGY
jgi:hypothetical protein